MERDSQKTKFYSWQNAKFGGKIFTKEMTSEECTALATDICRCYGVDLPTMKYPDGYQGQISYYKSSLKGKEIVLYKWARTRITVIHEVAHYISHTFNNDAAGHGPEYFSIFAYLVSQYMGFPLYEIFHKATQYGLQVASSYPTFKDTEKPNPIFVKRYC